MLLGDEEEEPDVEEATNDAEALFFGGGWAGMTYEKEKTEYLV